MNAMNTVNLIGRIPSTDKIPFNFKEGDEPKSNFFSFMISVRRAYKAKDEQYYEEDLIPVKAWGGAATAGKWIGRGDTVTVVGELRRGNDWEDNDGQTHRGQLEVIADSIRSVGGSKKDSDNDDEGATTKSAPKASGAKSSLKARLMNKKAGGHI